MASKEKNVTESYEMLAMLYDAAQWGTFAEGMADRALALAAEYSLGKLDHIVDVACGTGVAVAKFAAAGYHVTGVDRSPQMLAQAGKRVAEAKLKEVTLVEADMRGFALDEPADLVTCMYDSLNYLLEETGLLAAFRCAATALRSGGLYIFDMNTIFGLAEGWGSRDFIRWDSDDCFIVCRSCWDYERSINTLTLHGFNRQGESWKRFAETHVQRGYPVTTIRALLEQASLTVLTVCDFFAQDATEPGPEASRVLAVAQKNDA
jgi:SAM-dependent methyltransferase